MAGKKRSNRISVNRVFGKLHRKSAKRKVPVLLSLLHKARLAIASLF